MRMLSNLASKKVPNLMTQVGRGDFHTLNTIMSCGKQIQSVLSEIKVNIHHHNIHNIMEEKKNQINVNHEITFNQTKATHNLDERHDGWS